MKSLIRKILRWIFRGRKGPLKDKVTFCDSLKITMRYPDGSIYKQWVEKANTWVTYGRTQIRDALATGGFTLITHMYQNGTGGAVTMTTTNTTPATNKAKFTATWVAAGAITAITQFAIRQASGGSNLAEVSCTSFAKPDGISLEIAIETTIT